MLFVVTVVLLSTFWQTEASKMCYKAKTCFHNGKHKCGVNGKGEPRWFLDSCDILEFNCLKKTDYVITSTHKCKVPIPWLENMKIPGDDKIV